MKEKKTSRFNSFVMIMLIIFFLVGFCGAGVPFTKDAEQNVAKLNHVDNLNKDNYKNSVNFIEPQVFSFEEYLLTLELPSSLSEIEGNGLKDNPYRVKTVEEFVFLATQQLYNKYLSIECDIILNEEVFNQDGNVSDGDGIVYLFPPISTWYLCNVYANGNEIIGLYYKNISSTYSLFNNSYTSVYDLTVKNFYVEAKSVALISTGHLANIENVHTKDGFIACYGDFASGISRSSLKTAVNCSNGATIIQKGNEEIDIGGILVSANDEGMYKNLVNYGAIIVNNGNYVGGIVASSYGNSLLINCKNYGKIETLGGVQRGTAGISGSCQGAKFDSCENYGDILQSDSGWGGGGIIAYGGSQINTTYIVNCRNFGKIEGYAFAVDGGNLYINGCENYGVTVNGNGFIKTINSGSIINCLNYGNTIITTTNFVYCVFAETVKNDILIINSQSFGTVTDLVTAKNKCLIYATQNKSSVVFENIYVNMIFPDSTAFYFTINVGDVSYCVNNANLKIKGCNQVSTVYNSYTSPKTYLNNVSFDIDAKEAAFVIGNEISSVEITNLVVTGKNLSFTQKNLVLDKPKFIDGIVLTSTYKGQTQRFYIGSNFSSLTRNFRTGKIGIREHSAQSLFQDVITKDLLNAMEYQEKVL